MEQDRRSFLADTDTLADAHRRRRARLGRRRRGRAREGLQLPPHGPLVGHAHRHREVHRLRQLRPRLQGGERRAARATGTFRTWVERYQVDPTISITRSWTRRTAATTASPT